MLPPPRRAAPRLVLVEGLIVSLISTEKDSQPALFPHRENLWFNFMREYFAKEKEIQWFFLSFSDTRKLFDMSSFEKTQRLPGIRLISIAVVIGLEVFHGEWLRRVRASPVFVSLWSASWSQSDIRILEFKVDEDALGTNSDNMDNKVQFDNVFDEDSCRKRVK